MPSPLLTLTLLTAAPLTGVSIAFAINVVGQVVGQDDSEFPFIWTPQTPNGDAVGFADAFDPSGGQGIRAVFWAAGGATVRELGTLVPSLTPPGFFLGNSTAFGINNNGVIVGVSDSPAGVKHAFAFDLATGLMRDLGSLVPFTMLPGTPDPSRALGINDQGDIVGDATALDASGNVVTRAFIVPAGSVVMQDLGTLQPDPANPGSFLGDSFAFDINASGMIVGDSNAVPSPGNLITTAAFFQAGSAPVGMIPALSGARAINRLNVAVGFIGLTNSNAFQFDSLSGAADLTSQVGMPGMVIVRAFGINASGQIAAIANDGSATVAVLLTP